MIITSVVAAEVALAAACSDSADSPLRSTPCARCRPRILDAGLDGDAPDANVDADTRDVYAITLDGALDGDAADDALDGDASRHAQSSDGGEDASDSDGSTTEPKEACFYDEGACYGPLCSDEFMCVDQCTTDADCPGGHACVENRGRMLCSPYCSDRLCPNGQSCTGSCGVCDGCPTCPEGSFCMPSKSRCYPLDGRCDPGCPSFDVAITNGLDPTSCMVATKTIYQLGQVTCRSSMCRFDNVALSLEPVLDRVPSNIVFRGMRPDGTYRSVDELTIQWAAVEDPVLVLVLRNPPSPLNRADLLKHAIWGYAAAKNFSSPVKWSDGQRIEGEKWLEASPSPPPHEPLYVLVQAVRLNELERESPLLPLVIGTDWPVVGSRCVESEDEPEDGCRNPAAGVQVCFRSTCFRACASDADCEAPTRCGAPNAFGGRLRLCGY